MPAGWTGPRTNNHGIDFNPTCFSHPLADDGFTLSHADPGIRQFWIEHCIASREIGAYFGQELGTPAVTNIWIPDGYKDTPVDRLAPRQRLRDSLDQVFAEPIDPRHNLDAVEAKLFGIGSESYVVGSHEFYLGYAAANQTLLCLDAGHFHPTETIADKISSVTPLRARTAAARQPRGALGQRPRGHPDRRTAGDYAGSWCAAITSDRVHIGLDFLRRQHQPGRRLGYRHAATRCERCCMALLEPVDMLRELETAGDFTGRLALLEELKGLPAGRCGIITACSKASRSVWLTWTISAPTRSRYWPCEDKHG